MKSAEKNKNGGSLLNKSHSDGELLEDVNAGDNVVKSKPKAVKFVQPPTLPSYQQSEDDVSDRDLPELAPIEDYERIKGKVFSKVKIYRPILGSEFFTDPFWAVDSIQTHFGQ